MSLSTSLPDFKSRALAALNTAARGSVAVRTGNGIAGRACDPTWVRQFYVSPSHGITTWHESAALAVARLATL